MRAELRKDFLQRCCCDFFTALRVLSPSISTSGSTIGTNPASCDSAA